MKRLFDWVLGLTALFLGVAVGAWVAYNLLIERQAQTEGLSPVPALLLTGACFLVAYNRISEAVRRDGP